MTMQEAVLCLCIAYRMHGTDAAVISACYRIRDRVRAQCRPTINKVMRCSSPAKWAENVEMEMGW